ncbi:MAG: protein kinase domain-containing protein [Terriglobales bacterium]
MSSAAEPLRAGTTAGPYRIEGALGAGAMGEVYRALDTRLGREVALKLLAAGAAGADPDRQRRFEQEARAVAALNHPNLLAIYDVGELAGRPFLVTELLTGETLRQRLKAGPLPSRKVAEYGAQIAAGLAAAHAQGIIHRDLKPENLFVTDDRIKILDFGLAKVQELAAARGAEEVSPSSAPTLTATVPGAVLGTVGYMAPEQARGQAADARSDIFSLGAVLYEMAAGKRAFQGASAIETLSAILREDPPELAASGRDLPPGLVRLIDRCLEKSPARRLQNAQDVAFALENVTGSGSGSQIAPPPLPGPAGTRFRWWPAAAIVLAAVATGLVTWAFLRGRSAPLNFTQLTFRQGTISNARFEPGGGIVYSARWGAGTGSFQIYEQRPGDQYPHPIGLAAGLADISASGELAVLEGCRSAFYTACRGTLATTSASGGAARQRANDVIYAAWSPDGRQLAAVRQTRAGVRLDYPLDHLLWRGQPGEMFSSPRFSPDGRWIAFVDNPPGIGDAGNVEVIAARGGRPRVLAHGFNSIEGLAWAPDGRHIEIAGSIRTDMADAVRSISLSGADRVLERFPAQVQLEDLAPGGRMLLARESWPVQLRGRFPGSPAEQDFSWQDYTAVGALTPDGKQVIFCEGGIGGGPLYSAYIRPTTGGPALRLGDGWPRAISPDGQYVASYIPSQPSKLVLLPTGAGNPIPLRGLPQGTTGVVAWLPSGQALLLLAPAGDGGGVRIYRQALRDDRPMGLPRVISGPVLPSEHLPVSPDGGTALACSATDKHWYLYPTAGGAPHPLPVRLKAGEFPLRWSTHGRRLFVISGTKFPVGIDAINVATGQRSTLFTIAPQNMTGALPNLFVAPVMTPDGKYYAYSMARYLSVLFAVRPAHSSR